MFKKLLILFSITSMAALLVGCAATHTMISKRNLDVQTKMSDTIFLTPVENSQKTIYVQIKNTSDKSEFNVTNKIKTALENKGYKVVNNLNQAHYLLQANILRVGKYDPTAAEKAFAGGYGSTIATVGAGVAIGALVGNNSNSVLVGGLAAGLIDTIANAVVKDVTYIVITDLQVSEKTAKNTKIGKTDIRALGQGDSISIQESSVQTGWAKYQTRIMSMANKVNLNFKEALPLLEDGLVNSVAGIF